MCGMKFSSSSFEKKKVSKMIIIADAWKYRISNFKKL